MEKGGYQCKRSIRNEQIHFREKTGVRSGRARHVRLEGNEGTAIELNEHRVSLERGIDTERTTINEKVREKEKERKREKKKHMKSQEYIGSKARLKYFRLPCSSQQINYDCPSILDQS